MAVSESREAASLGLHAACVHHLFEAQVTRTPKSDALLFGGESVSYGELNARANRLAHFLRDQGIERESVVGVRMTSGVSWEARSATHRPASRPPPADDVVEVWAAHLQLPEAALSVLWSYLDSEERARAERFHFPKDRDAFVAARGSLRALLGSYLDKDPRSVRFGYGAQGKPFLESPEGDSPVRFNLSHSDGLVLFAIGRQETGIDVERVRSLPDLLELADRFFSRQEVANLRAVPTAEQARAFFRCWTAKEAYIKARGEGLSMPLDRFAVSLTPPAGRIALVVHGSPQETDRWSLNRFEPAADYIAAVAVEGACRFAEMGWIGRGPLAGREA